ncbi:hypothetical protein FOVG_18645 [Fusarium oxysporum f. sp. pisi HDV247]|uniref:Ecp2 effector protein domain-containing protein n=1 Tax=Fusarium oxysporum f. sp. pisi HDV247 TaxID=1080344 RepID=W9NQ24_FUSOX|nr:hypothetical protein FOVG_18645 [Fusarium oxysporum f. sp. pisi HDV247]
MRVSPFSALIACGNLATAWTIALYSGSNCNSDDQFEYFSIDGEGSMPFCDAPTSTMHGVTRCAYFRNNGHDGPYDCDRQFDRWHSARVIRGEMMIWATYDDHPDQPDNARCGSPQQSDGLNTVFRAGGGDNGCFNSLDNLNPEGYSAILAREGAPQ